MMFRTLAAAAAVCWFGLGAHARAECVPAPDLAPARNAAEAQVAAGPTHNDRNGRVVAPVTINGQGPYPFIVDTGANRSVLSQELARELGLTPTGEGQVHSIDSVMQAPLVSVRSLQYGSVAVTGENMPILHQAVMGEQAGVLGVDGMSGKRLRMDFDRRCIEIIPSSRAPALHGWVRLDGQLRFGHLVLIRGAVRTVAVNILIDTGSDISLGNEAFRAAIVAQTRPDHASLEYSRLLTAGRPLVLDHAVIVPHLSLGRVYIHDLTAYIGDFHIFDLWGLKDEPTILVGMDVLSRTHAIAIDYARGLVHIRLNTWGT